MQRFFLRVQRLDQRLRKLHDRRTVRRQWILCAVVNGGGAHARRIIFERLVKRVFAGISYGSDAAEHEGRCKWKIAAHDPKPDVTSQASDSTTPALAAPQ